MEAEMEVQMDPKEQAKQILMKHAYEMEAQCQAAMGEVLRKFQCKIDPVAELSASGIQMHIKLSYVGG